MSGLRVVGFDTSLSAFGMVAGVVDLDDAGRPALRFVDGGVVQTEKNPEEPRMNADHLVRFGVLSHRSLAFVKKHDPHVICVEQVALALGSGGKFGAKMSGTLTNLSVLGRARGLVDMLAVSVGAMLLERSAMAIKKAATGSHRATKEEMVDALTAKHPELGGIYVAGPSGKVLRGLREHVADAAGAVLACRMDPVMLERLETILGIDRAVAVMGGGDNFDGDDE